MTPKIWMELTIFYLLRGASIGLEVTLSQKMILYLLSLSSSEIKYFRWKVNTLQPSNTPHCYWHRQEQVAKQTASKTAPRRTWRKVPFRKPGQEWQEQLTLVHTGILYTWIIFFRWQLIYTFHKRPKEKDTGHNLQIRPCRPQDSRCVWRQKWDKLTRICVIIMNACFIFEQLLCIIFLSCFRWWHMNYASSNGTCNC